VVCDVSTLLARETKTVQTKTTTKLPLPSYHYQATTTKLPPPRPVLGIHEGRSIRRMRANRLAILVQKQLKEEEVGLSAQKE
jgi:hypothetical protein